MALNLCKGPDNLLENQGVSSMRILIVDDELVSREKLRTIMDTLGECIVVENGEDALRVATAENPPDLILLDIIMPEMDGYEVCKRLKANRKTSNIPVIFITIRSEEEDEAEGLELGAVDYIRKPFRPSIVKARVQAHLELKKHRNRLEELVNERTIELREANRKLKQEIEDRQSAEEKQKGLEAKLHHAQKMEALGSMAGGVAHDLNNILAGVVGYPDLLLLDLPQESPLRKPLQIIMESGQRAADVVEDLLTVARGIATSKEVLNLNTIVEEHLNSPEHKRLATIHPFVVFRTEFALDLLNISCSPLHIGKVLINLVTNAAEAIEGSGTVTISTRNQYLDEPIKGYEDVKIGEYAVLSVSDDGRGISREDLERIFEPFYTKKIMGRSGTGLGLAVVWNTVQDHGGYINVNSSERGTTFELHFPTSREEAAAVKQGVPIENYLGHGERILVVDDVERQREIACGFLRRLGYTPEAVSSGEEAIEYLRNQPVDLIVLDMIMPKGINGCETYQEIVKIHPGQKAIIVSGFSETEDVKIAQRLGAGKYIKKPYTVEKIGLAVREELEK